MSTTAIQLRRKVRINLSVVVTLVVVAALVFAVAFYGRPAAQPQPLRPADQAAVTTTRFAGPSAPIVVNGRTCHQCMQP